MNRLDAAWFIAVMGSVFGSTQCWASPQRELFESFLKRGSPPSTQNVQLWRDAQEREKRSRVAPAPKQSAAPKVSTPSKSPSSSGRTGAVRAVRNIKVAPLRLAPTRTSKSQTPKKASPATTEKPAINGEDIPSQLQF